MPTKRTIPSRTFGKKTDNRNLSQSVPVIGIGCSSFANNFVVDEADIDDDLSVCQNTAHLLPANHPKVQEWIETLQLAIHSGIYLLDTAPWYGHGSSEIVIGLTMKRPGVDRSKLIINTKIGRYDKEPMKQFDFSYDATIKSVQRSIERMECDYIDVLQLHDPEFAPSIDLIIKETIPAMMECKRRGWTKALGLTGYSLELHYQILERAKELSISGEPIFDQILTYGHLNIHNQNLCIMPVNPNHDQSLMEYCEANSLALMAAAPLSMGILSHNPPPFWHPASNSLKQACLDAARIAEGHNVNLPMLAILVALAHDAVGCTLLGMGCKNDVDNALAAVKRYTKMHDLEEKYSPDCKCATSGIKDNGKALRMQLQCKLASILSDSEATVLQILFDELNGPFADIWHRNEQAWDGIGEADNFWSRVDGGKEAAEIRMRVRSVQN